MVERRIGERLDIPEQLRVEVHENGRLVGQVRTLSPGGMLIRTDQQFSHDRPQDFHVVILCDDAEPIEKQLKAKMLYTRPVGVVFQFESLEWSTALEIGRLIEKTRAKRNAPASLSL